MFGANLRSAALPRALFLVMALLPVMAKGTTQFVEESADYQMSDADSRDGALQKCTDRAKRAALDRVGSVFEARLSAQKSEGGTASGGDADLSMSSYLAAVVSIDVRDSTVSLAGDRITLGCRIRLGYDADTVQQKMRSLADSDALRLQVARQQETIDRLNSASGSRTMAPAYATPHDVAPVNPPPIYQTATAYDPIAAPPPPLYWRPRPISVAQGRPIYRRAYVSVYGMPLFAAIHGRPPSAIYFVRRSH